MANATNVLLHTYLVGVSCLVQRLSIGQCIQPQHVGFGANRFILPRLVKLFERHSALHVLFLDRSQAFSCIGQSQLTAALERYGVPHYAWPQLITVRLSIQVASFWSSYPLSKRIRQGCPLIGLSAFTVDLRFIFQTVFFYTHSVDLLRQYFTG